MTIIRPLPQDRGIISQLFGDNVEEYSRYGFAGHEGLDYACPIGTTVFASENGVVRWSGWSTGANSNYGLYVVLDHGKFETWYAHLFEASVKINDNVTQGQIIGKSGNTGKSTGPHLHFAVRVHGARNGSKGFVDPWAMRVILGGDE